MLTCGVAHTFVTGCDGRKGSPIIECLRGRACRLRRKQLASSVFFRPSLPQRPRAVERPVMDLRDAVALLILPRPSRGPRRRDHSRSRIHHTGQARSALGDRGAARPCRHWRRTETRRSGPGPGACARRRPDPVGRPPLSRRPGGNPGSAACPLGPRPGGGAGDAIGGHRWVTRRLAVRPRSCQAVGNRLGRTGVTVVSGLARGVDSAAHRAALAGPGRTVAVLGSGADVVCPAEHSALAAAISIDGALISKLLPGTPPRPEHFSLRNRIISGLSLAIVVVEASERRGSLITARCGLEQGREVMAVPGSVLTGLNRGSHALIRIERRLLSVRTIL